MHPELKQQLYGGEISDYYKETLVKQKSQGVEQDYKDIYSVYKTNVANNLKNQSGIQIYK